MHAMELEKAQTQLAKKKASKAALKSQLKEQNSILQFERTESERLIKEADQNLETKR